MNSILLLLIITLINTNEQDRVRTQIINTICNQQGITTTLCIHGAIEPNVTWELYLDRVDNMSMIAKGDVEEKDTLITAKRECVCKGRHTLLLITKKDRGEVIDIVKSDVEIEGSKIVGDLHNNLGIMMGGVIGILSSCLTMLIHSKLGERKDKKNNIIAFIGKTACMIQDIKTYWGVVDKENISIQVVGNEDFAKVWYTIKNPSVIWSKVEAVKRIHRMWMNNQATNEHKNELDKLLEEIEYVAK